MCEKKCVSLFSCAGFGDLGLHKAGIDTISACEIVKERADLLQKNFPSTRVFIGDIWDLQDDIITHAQEQLGNDELYMMIISAPCQGASSNGMGRIQNEIRRGRRSKDDPRNRLILPAINIIQQLKPKFLLIENVAGMRHTQILNEDNVYETIFSIFHRKLHEYVLRSKILNTADFGVPQNRKRLITIGLKEIYTNVPRTCDFFMEDSFLHPMPTHGTFEVPHITLKTCFTNLLCLDAKHKLQDDADIFHRIPSWNDMQYFCMSHTPEGQTAFKNTKCVACSRHTPDLTQVYCCHCQAVLPRPCMHSKHGKLRIIKAFHTAYRRMTLDNPANALTTNSGVISSDVKGHPIENRVLSLREIMIIASVGNYVGNEVLFDYEFPQNDKLIRHVLGECIPPLLTFQIATYLETFDACLNQISKKKENSNGMGR